MNWLDRAVSLVAPQAALRRVQARAFLSYLSGGYTGARTDRRATKEWNPQAQSPDADTIGDLPTLRARSSDLIRNMPMAAAAVKTTCTKVIGTGLTVHPKVDAEMLGLTQEQASAWNRRAKRLFRHVATTKALDIAGRRTFFELQHQLLFSVLERGDALVIRRENTARGALLRLAIQLVEADRLSNPLSAPDREGLVAGIESDSDGRIQGFHVASQHPLEYGSPTPKWTKVPAVGPDSGLPLAWLMDWSTRPGQSRGVPMLATVIESLKQIERYGEAELMAAVISAMFTVFVKSPHDVLGAGVPAASGDPKTPGPQYRMGTGAVARLLPGEDVSFANPMRPNAQFAPFIQAWAEQTGAGLELPAEVLLKRFTASYSASRGAQLEAWEPLWIRREWLALSFCQPLWEQMLAEFVARGWIDAPGFFDDPWVRLAYSRALWVGPAPGQIDPRVEVEAAERRVAAGFSTLEEETFALTGGDWEDNLEQLAIERAARERAGLTASAAPTTGSATASAEERDQQDANESQGREDDTRQQADQANAMASMVAERAAQVAAAAIAQARREDQRERTREREQARAQRDASATQQAQFLAALQQGLETVAAQPVAMPPMHITIEAPAIGKKRTEFTRNASGEIVGAVTEGVA